MKTHRELYDADPSAPAPPLGEPTPLPPAIEARLDEPSNFTHLREHVAEAREALRRVAPPSSPEQDRDGLYYPLLFLTETVEAVLRHVLKEAYASVSDENAGAARFLSHASGWVKFHDECGRGSAESGPDHSDCACRGTTWQSECAAQGCGFCLAARRSTPSETPDAASRPPAPRTAQ